MSGASKHVMWVFGNGLKFVSAVVCEHVSMDGSCVPMILSAVLIDLWKAFLSPSTEMPHSDTSGEDTLHKTSVGLSKKRTTQARFFQWPETEPSWRWPRCFLTSSDRQWCASQETWSSQPIPPGCLLSTEVALSSWKPGLAPWSWQCWGQDWFSSHRRVLHPPFAYGAISFPWMVASSANLKM